MALQVLVLVGILILYRNQDHIYKIIMQQVFLKVNAIIQFLQEKVFIGWI